MPRFYFHARSGAEQVLDSEGVDLVGLENIREYVLEIAAEVPVGAGWVFEVTDDQGQVRMVISLDRSQQH